MGFKFKLTAAAALLTLTGGGIGMAASAAGASTAAPARAASTPTCNDCTHVQNVYAFRGNLDSIGQRTTYNNPVILWYGNASTGDPGQDIRWVLQGQVAHNGHYAAFNQLYHGDTVIRLQYTPHGDNSANVYLGLNGLKIAIRPDNQVNPDWQSYIVDLIGPHGEAILINVAESTNPADPMVMTDPGYAVTGSKTQIDLEPLNVNQNRDVDTSQLWRDGDYNARSGLTLAPVS